MACTVHHIPSVHPKLLVYFPYVGLWCNIFALPLSIEKTVTVCPVVVYRLMKKSRRLDRHEREDVENSQYDSKIIPLLPLTQ